MIGRDEKGKARVFRISVFEPPHSLGPDPKRAPAPRLRSWRSDGPIPFGRRPGEVRELPRHEHSAVQRPARAEAADRGWAASGVMARVATTSRRWRLASDDLAIARPGLASAAQITRLCDTCHNSDNPSITDTDPLTIRFQTLTCRAAAVTPKVMGV